MPHLHRFHIDAKLPDDASIATLTEQEAHHALHVVRVKPGDEVAVFDGKGRTWQGTVEATTRHEVTIALGEYRQSPLPAARVALFQAWLHREKAIEELIRHGTEIGISRFVFFPAHHSERKPRFSDKWRRTAIEACKQCGRVWLPSFEVADSLESALSIVQGTLLLATRDVEPVPIHAVLSQQEVSLMIGPEGDFTERELGEVIARGGKPISLGDVTYRAEVAAIVASTVVLYELQERRGY